MDLQIEHVTTYEYDQPVEGGLQQLRLTARSMPGQTVHEWSTSVEGGTKQVEFTDHFGNHVELVKIDRGAETLQVRGGGRVRTENHNGVRGIDAGGTPLWLFQRSTPLSAPGPLTRDLVAHVRSITGDNDALIERLHALSAEISKRVKYQPGATRPTDAAEHVLEAGAGVCQDHAHIFVTAARLLGFPARYVSGYLRMGDTDSQDASHAWAEVYVEALGWVGFDVSNEISPDDRYVQVAVGLDYEDAAPISGIRFGAASESLTVQVHVQIQQ
jgi:transglutaminase-like putative cysteine protease